MYTKKHEYGQQWTILTPDGNVLCTVLYEYDADALLSHLNR